MNTSMLHDSLQFRKVRIWTDKQQTIHKIFVRMALLQLQLVSKNTAMVTCKAGGEHAAVTASCKTQSCLHCGEFPVHLPTPVQLCPASTQTVHKDLENRLHFCISDCARDLSCNVCWNINEIIKIYHSFFTSSLLEFSNGNHALGDFCAIILLSRLF